METEALKLHQTLHGYYDGHSMLASSCKELSDVTERTLLIQSDLSGSTPSDGFESYVTGYPLKLENLFAFARTWYAPEMHRPGCVWTHTLLIGLNDIPKIRDLGILLTLFKRPDLRSERFEHYSQPLVIEKSNLNTGKNLSKRLAVSNTRVLLRQILLCLYASSNSPVYVLSESSTSIETLVIELWNQQWPRLRRTFTFCTGALSPRVLQGRQFDLQVSPYHAKRDIQREYKEASIVTDRAAVNDTQSIKEVEGNKWLEVALNDLHDSNVSSKFRNYLWLLGAEFDNGRGVYCKLAEIFVTLIYEQEESHLCDSLVKKVARYFPNEDEAINLKRELLRNLSGHNWGNVSIKNETWLNCLLFSEHIYAFRPKELAIRTRILELWDCHPTEAFALIERIIDGDANLLAEEVLDVSLQYVNLDLLSEVGSQDKRLLLTLLKRKPELGQNKVFWTFPFEDQQDFLNAFISSLFVEDEIISKTLKAILDEGSYRIAMRFVSYYGWKAGETFLDWMNQSHFSEDDSYDLERILSNIGERKILHWLRNQQRLTTFCSYYVVRSINPSVKKMNNVNIDLFVPQFKELVHNENRFVAQNHNTEIRVFFVALAFCYKDDVAADFLAQFFYDIYVKVLEGRLSSSDWSKLDSALPPLAKWWEEWDKCKRMRQGYADVFVRNSWSHHKLLKGLPERKLRNDVLKYMKRSSKAGKRFVKNIESYF